jgi:alkanesulfonate monooxygenase SsuD/methylene tetrahydromethanopterin reductase-like flavin-dependent oxidoreductase (luciferase family)
MEFFLYLPQTRMGFDRLVQAAETAEAAGFTGMAGMDHLVTPQAEDQPLYDAFITNTWLAARTTRLKLGSLVLCDAFRHPAVLARLAVSLDHASGGRFELGIGSGSWDNDFKYFGLAPAERRERLARLGETLHVLRALWSGETVTYHGKYHRLDGARQMPKPLTKIPIVVGGVAPKTLALVKEYADWCNLDVRYLGRLEGAELPKLRDQIGNARISVQQMSAYVHKEVDREQVAATARRRFGEAPLVATGPELAEHYARFAAKGVERVYAWFCDFAPPETIAAFGADVITPLRAGALRH